MTANYQSIIPESRTRLKGALDSALQQYERRFLSDDFSEKLADSVRQGVESLEIGFKDLAGAAWKKEKSELVSSITKTLARRTRPILAAHLKRCNKEYVRTIQDAGIEVLNDVITMHPSKMFGSDVDTSLRNMTSGAGVSAVADLVGVMVGVIGTIIAAQAVVTTQTTLLVFTSTVVNPLGIVGLIAAGIAALFFGKNLMNPGARIKRKLCEELVPIFSNRRPEGNQKAGILYDLWEKEIYPAHKDDFQRLWSGTHPGGSPVMDESGKPFEGLEITLRKALEKRWKRVISANLPKAISDKFEIEDAPLKREIARYWRKLPQVPEDAFVVAIVGPTSAGKSTLMNLLLGNQFIEERISEHTTPCPILLRGGEKGELRAFKEGRKSALLEFAPGAVKPVPKLSSEAIHGWFEDTVLNRQGLKSDHKASFWKPLASISPLQRIEVTYPVEWMPENLVLADLPGVEGHFENEEYEKAYELTELSRLWMARADVVIFVLRREQVRLANCYRFLKEFEQKERPMAVLISHMDDLDLLEMNAEGPESGREVFLDEVLSFFRDNGIDGVDSENVFLGASRFKRDAWDIEPEGKRVQQLALQDIARLGRWLVNQLGDMENEHTRSLRQYQADQEIRRNVYEIFAAHLVPLTTEALGAINYLPPDNLMELLSGEDGLEWAEGLFWDHEKNKSYAPMPESVGRIFMIRDEILKAGLCMLRVPRDL